MKRKIPVVTVGLLLLALLVGGASEVSQAQFAGPPRGARQLLGAFFGAVQVGDLALLSNGGVISGSVQGESFTVTLSESGQQQVYQRSDLATITFGDPADQVLLLNGSLVAGELQLDALALRTPEGSQLSLSVDELQLALFQLDLPSPRARPQPGQQPTGERPNRAFFALFQGLQAQNLFARFAQSLVNFDMIAFADGKLWSGAVQNAEILFHSNTFGTLTIGADDLSSIELSADLEEADDFVTLKSGDRVSGRIDADSLIRFQPVGLVDEGGNPATLTLARGEASLISFRQPASAFGSGGGGPGFGGGPGS